MRAMRGIVTILRKDTTVRKSILLIAVAGLLAFAVTTPASAQDPVAVLKSDAPLIEKAAAFRALARVGGIEAIPTLESYLLDEKVSHMARLALQPMPYPEAGTALRNALPKSSGALKVGIVKSLAVRKDVLAVPALSALLNDADAVVAQTAARALGSIATEEAINALGTAVAKPELEARTLRAISDALLDVAEDLDKGQAIALYDRLLSLGNAPREVRAAALRGAILARGGQEGPPLLANVLRGEDQSLFDAALRTAREMGDAPEVTAVLAAELPALNDERKLGVIQLLGQRGGDAAGPAVLAQAERGSPSVRIAALAALTRMGHGPALPLMAQLALDENEEIAQAARDALSYFPGQEGDDLLLAMLKEDSADKRVMAVELINKGGLPNPVDRLMAVATNDAAESVRVAALKALENHAGLPQLSGLLERLLSAKTPDELAAAESAMQALCVRQKGTPVGAVEIKSAVYGALPEGPTADVTAKVAEIVAGGSLTIAATNGSFGDPSPGLRKQLRVTYTENGSTASRTVDEGQTLVLTTAWVPAEIVDTLCAALNTSQGDTTHALLRILGATGSKTALDAVRAAASGDDAGLKETAIRALCTWPTPDALPTVMALVTDSQDDTLKTLAVRGAIRLIPESDLAAPERCAHYATLLEHSGSPDEAKRILGGLGHMNDLAALSLALTQIANDAVRAEAIQSATAIAANLNAPAREDSAFFNGTDLSGWDGDTKYWSVKDGEIVGGSREQIGKNEFLWSAVEVGDFYLALDVKLEPNTANAGIQIRSTKIDASGQAQGYQADIGETYWGRLYHEHGRDKLDWRDNAENAVKPGEWNRYEILAIGPAIWIAINGALGAACVEPDGEKRGSIALQVHSGAPQSVHYRIKKLIHNPKLEIAGQEIEKLLGELRVPPTE